MNKAIFVSLAMAAAAILFSCQSTGIGGNPDQRALAKGRSAWNAKNPEAARSSWIAIKDKALKDRQLGYIGSYAAAEKALKDADGGASASDERVLASWKKASSGFSALPPELELPQAVKARGKAIAEHRMRSLIDRGSVASARDMGAAAISLYGPSPLIRTMLAEAESILDSRSAEAAAASALAAARASEDFERRIAGFESAAKSYAAAEAALAKSASAASVQNSPGVLAAAGALKRSRQAAAVEKEKLLRERAYGFKDRIGAQFARQAEGDPATMGLEGLLAHQESVKAAVESEYAQMAAFAGRYPSVIDASLLRDILAQKRALDAKIEEVNREIRTARDIASRGKPVMPLLIGLFNPQPGTAAESKKSRPALFRGSAPKGSDWWWGMLSVEPGAMNDLVITMADSRPVRVFSDNTLSGTMIAKKGLKDLVNRAQKAGNSWPVLNAGERLAEGRWYMEIQEGSGGPYRGEAVVYSSFIARMR